MADIPAEMVEAAAMALAGHVDVLHPDAGMVRCSCGEWSAPFDRRVIDNAPHRRHVAAVVLAAVLSVAEVREEWGADTGTYVTQHPRTRSEAERDVDAANDHSRRRGHQPHASLVRRLHFTTPWREVEP